MRSIYVMGLLGLSISGFTASEFDGVVGERAKNRRTMEYMPEGGFGDESITQ